MSDLAFFRFLSYNLLTEEEKKDKDEILKLTEEVLNANGIECDSKISKLSRDQIQKILDEVRKLRKRKKGEKTDESKEQCEDQETNEEKPEYIQ